MPTEQYNNSEKITKMLVILTLLCPLQFVVVYGRTRLMLSGAQDLFNLGCLIFYFITKGHHPFGLVQMRDTNIKRNCPDLALVKHHYEAAHLISNLLHPQPEMR